MFHATGLPGWMRFGWGGQEFIEESPPETEKQFLEEEAAALNSRLDIIRKLLDELKGEEDKKS